MIFAGLSIPGRKPTALGNAYNEMLRLHQERERLVRHRNQLKSVVADEEHWKRLNARMQKLHRLCLKASLTSVAIAMRDPSKVLDACNKVERFAESHHDSKTADLSMLQVQSVAARAMAASIRAETEAAIDRSENWLPEGGPEAVFQLVYQAYFARSKWKDFPWAALSSHGGWRMFFLPFDLQQDYMWKEKFDKVDELLPLYDTAFTYMRNYKGSVNEPQFGVRLAKVLDKPRERDLLVAEQHRRRCQLHGYVCNAELLAQEIGNALGSLEDLTRYRLDHYFTKMKKGGANAIKFLGPQDRVLSFKDNDDGSVTRPLSGSMDLLLFASSALYLVGLQDMWTERVRKFQQEKASNDVGYRIAADAVLETAHNKQPLPAMREQKA
jgi:hypothetical protein